MRALFFLLLGLLPVAAVAAPRSEVRGIWVVRTGLVSPESVDRVVDQAYEGGFNALFVQVRGRGDAFYQSRLVPRSDLLQGQPASFDPLGRLLERAHARGLEVHAWVNVLLTAHFLPLLPTHILSLHPEWVMVPRSVAEPALRVPPRVLPGLVREYSRAADPDAEGYYLSPSAPGVPEYLESVVREVVRNYPLDGLHLDFIRYPGPQYDHSPPALEAFRRLVGGDLLRAPSTNPSAWGSYLRDTLTALALRLAQAVRAERPGLPVSAAVVPDEATAVTQRFQNWPEWLTKGILDDVCPMTYTPDNRIFLEQVTQARARASGGQGVWAGVGAYRLSLAGVVEKIRLARQAGASGIIVFSHESFSPSQWKGLRAAAFSAPVADTTQAPRGLAVSQR